MSHSYQAELAVAKARRKGELVPQRCEVCGASENLEAHHDDYTALLDVRWLCRRHHASHHVKYGSPPVPDGDEVTMNIRIDRETYGALRRLAEIGDRTVAQEMRRALRRYVADATELLGVAEQETPA